MHLLDDFDDPYATIAGEHVILGDITPAHFPLIHAWLNDLETLRSAGVLMRPTTRAGFLRIYERGMSGMRDDQIWFLISERASGTPVGFTLLRDIDNRHQSCEFAITIGPASQRGLGFGTEATRLTVDYAFTVLEMHSVLLTVAAFNQRGIRAYQRAGFREIGRQRESWVLAGQRYDTVFMECLAPADDTIAGTDVAKQ